MKGDLTVFSVLIHTLLFPKGKTHFPLMSRASALYTYVPVNGVEGYADKDVISDESTHIAIVIRGWHLSGMYTQIQEKTTQRQFTCM